MHLSSLPNFIFIVGAPRCGTTTLADWLKQHPRICFPFVKEPHTFLQHDLRGLNNAALARFVEREYLDRFYAGCGADRDTGVDGSVSYLYAPDMLVPALKLWPNAKFVIAVRDPMTMLPSLHARLRYTGDETIKRFDDAWAAIPERAAGRRIPRSCLDPRWLRYDEAGRFGTYVDSGDDKTKTRTTHCQGRTPAEFSIQPGTTPNQQSQRQSRRDHFMGCSVSFRHLRSSTSSSAVFLVWQAAGHSKSSPTTPTPSTLRTRGWRV